jgi:hypothetical protein
VHAFGNNSYEREIFELYATRRGLSLQQLFREVLTFRGSSLPRATWHGRAFAPFDPTAVNLGDKICLSCASDLVEASLFEWWLLRRSDVGLPRTCRLRTSRSIALTNLLLAEVMTRPDCEHGIECRVACLNRYHARTHNHICRPTVTDRVEDNDGDIPERGHRHVANSPDLNHNFPAFSPSNIIFRDKGKEPVFLCSAICWTAEHGTATIPGKVTLWNESTATVYYGLSGTEHAHDRVVQILMDTRNMHWVRTSRGIIPAGCRPVLGGSLVLDGVTQELFHCAVWWFGQRIPGYTSRQMRHASFTWDGLEWYIEDQYELLCWN